MSNVTRWDPFQEMLTLREAMSQLLEESVVRGSNTASRSGQGFVPAFDVSETADAFVIEAALPGVTPDDLSITFENNMLTLSGEVRQRSDRSEHNMHRLERRYGKFQRSLSLPVAVRGDAIEAHLEHGVLHLSVPKAEEVKPRKISISLGQGEQQAITQEA